MCPFFQRAPPSLSFATSVGIVVTIVMAFPLNIFPTRYTIEVIMARYACTGGRPSADDGGDDAKDKRNVPELEPMLPQEPVYTLPPSRVRHFTLTFILTALSLLVALVVPDISTVFQLMGGTASAFVCFVLPAAFAIKLDYLKPGVTKVGAWALAVGGVLVGVVSTAVTVQGIVEKDVAPSSDC